MAATEGIFPGYGAPILNSMFRGAAFPTPPTVRAVQFFLDHPGITAPSMASAQAAYTTRTLVAFSLADTGLIVIRNSLLITVGPVSANELWKYFVVHNHLTTFSPYWSGTVNGGVGASVSSGTSPTIQPGEMQLSMSYAS